jgi:hypothetical protein
VISKIKIKTGLSVIIGLLAMFLATISIISLQSLSQSNNSIITLDRIEGDQIIPLNEIYSDLLSARIIGQKIATTLSINPQTDINYLLQKQNDYIISSLKVMTELRDITPLTLEEKIRKPIDLSFDLYIDKAIFPMQKNLKKMISRVTE